MLEDAVRTTTARCLVITGADPAFCSGDDVKQVMGGGERADRPVDAVSPRLTPAADALLHTDVPVDRRGERRGRRAGGWSSPLMADIRVARERARSSVSCSCCAACAPTSPASAAWPSSSAGRRRPSCCSPAR